MNTPAKKGFLICMSGPGCAIDQQTGQAFVGVKECVQLLCRVADVVELTPTNSRAARSEWNSSGLPACDVLPIRRRDISICLAELMDRGYEGRYTMLIGYGDRDREAARRMGAFFFPIIPEHESACWNELAEEGLPKLLHGTFMGVYQQRLIARHNSVLKKE